MGQALDVHRLHFAFTITFHYIFPQLTMGLALLIVYLKTKALRTGDEHYNRAADSGLGSSGLNFALGVVTGIPDGISVRDELGSVFEGGGRRVIGQTLAMEGVFSFFLESSSLGLFLFGEKKAWPNRTLGGCVSGFSGLVALGLFHRGDGRVDAASHRLPDWRQRGDRTRQLLGSAAEQVGALAVRAHDAGRGAKQAASSWAVSPR